MRVDPKGFYLCWVDQNNELDILDIATIRDVRNGQYAKKPRVSKVATFCPTDTLMKATNKKRNHEILSVKVFDFIWFVQFRHLLKLISVPVFVSGKTAQTW